MYWVSLDSWSVYKFIYIRFLFIAYVSLLYFLIFRISVICQVFLVFRVHNSAFDYDEKRICKKALRSSRSRGAEHPYQALMDEE
jgi:hypothetical protein